MEEARIERHGCEAALNDKPLVNQDFTFVIAICTFWGIRSNIFCGVLTSTITITITITRGGGGS